MGFFIFLRRKTMTWRTLFIKESEYIKLKLDNLEISKQGSTIYVPLSDIAMIILEGNHTTITTKLLTRLSKYNILLVICDDKYLPTGMYLSYGSYHRSAKRGRQQAAWTEQLKKAMWQQIVRQKTRNQILLAQEKDTDSQRIELMEDLYQQIMPGDETNREGHIAKLYFHSLYGVDFTRDDSCIENLAMNFGYAIIRSAIARMVVGQGLIPLLGIFHCNEYNSFNLVDDLMEPFRPLMDFWIHRMVIGKEEYLSYESRIHLIDFMNQSMRYKNQKSTVDQVMQKYINSFVQAMEKEKVDLIHTIDLKDFFK
jgi:CRISPR-associated protein Cas1